MIFIIVNYMKKNIVKESSGSGSAGAYSGPIVLSPQMWKENQVGPFTEPVYQYTNAELAYEEADGDFKESPEARSRIENKTKSLSKLNMELKKKYMNQNDEDGGAVNPTMSGEPLKEDLAVWFGTKKKPKGSKQPAGPWVNICRKENGKHPPCGRDKAENKGYPKCRAVGVASKMTASEKRSACQQKRKAEKTNPKIGTGNKPKMTSYKPRNEELSTIIRRVIRENFNQVSSK
jgi:hypothetical protein